MDARLAVSSVIGIFALMFIGLIVVGALQDVAESQDLGSEGNDTRTSLITNIHTAFTLFVILPIIVGAGVLMRYLGWFG